MKSSAYKGGGSAPLETRSHSKGPVNIRPAGIEDAERIALLAGQLGYPSSPTQVTQRLRNLKGDDRHAVFVAESHEGSVIGWVHAFVCSLVESDPYAEIGGLIVDEQHRGAGVGGLLLEQAELLARAKDCASLRLRSNIIRKEAHAFYLKRGYTITKTQHAFAKTL
ncbi:MAG: GNAT family N-acetyltransferase [Terriglobales bacterium]